MATATPITTLNENLLYDISHGQTTSIYTSSAAIRTYIEDLAVVPTAHTLAGTILTTTLSNAIDLTVDLVSLTAGATVYTASNGLTLSTADFQLGGTITADTSLDLDTGYILTIGDYPSGADSLRHFIDFSDAGISLAQANYTETSLIMNSVSGFLVAIPNSASAVNGMHISDGRAIPKGCEYSNDYSATFVDNSLITKKYVDDTIISTVVPGTESAVPAYVAATNNPMIFTSGTNLVVKEIVSDGTLEISNDSAATGLEGALRIKVATPITVGPTADGIGVFDIKYTGGAPLGLNASGGIYNVDSSAAGAPSRLYLPNLTETTIGTEWHLSIYDTTAGGANILLNYDAAGAVAGMLQMVSIPYSQSNQYGDIVASLVLEPGTYVIIRKLHSHFYTLAYQN